MCIMSTILAVFIGDRLRASIEVRRKRKVKQDFELLDNLWAIRTAEMSSEVGPFPKRPDNCPL